MTELQTIWHTREYGRFMDGTYTRVPVQLDYPESHFVHMSVAPGEGEHVAYTPSDAYGEADRQVRLKFGRYLKKTFPELTDCQIQAHVTNLKGSLAVIEQPTTSLHFATDVETLNRIFETEMRACGSSMTSCMYGKFTGTIRPYHVYANSPDVAVAYMLRGENIVARSVVSVKDKVWVRAYSSVDGDNDTDCGLIKQLLKDAGYSKGDLYDNRLSKLKTRKVMLPYIDNNGAHVTDEGDYWVVTDGDGDYVADCTDGTATDNTRRCSTCDCPEDECECSYCECCQERYADGCDTCSTCEECDGCTTHGGCNCDRCSECHELTSECECDKCEHCGELTENCECEDSPEDSPEEDSEPPMLAITPEGLRNKISRIWAYILTNPVVVDTYCVKEACRQILQNAYNSIDDSVQEYVI